MSHTFSYDAHHDVCEYLTVKYIQKHAKMLKPTVVITGILHKCIIKVCIYATCSTRMVYLKCTYCSFMGTGSIQAIRVTLMYIFSFLFFCDGIHGFYVLQERYYLQRVQSVILQYVKQCKYLSCVSG